MPWIKLIYLWLFTHFSGSSFPNFRLLSVVDVVQQLDHWKGTCQIGSIGKHSINRSYEMDQIKKKCNGPEYYGGLFLIVLKAMLRVPNLRGNRFRSLVDFFTFCRDEFFQWRWREFFQVTEINLFNIWFSFDVKSAYF